jgi:hypothetical protein
MAKSRSRKGKSPRKNSRKGSRKSPRKFLLKKGSQCPTGYLRIKQVKKSSKKYGTRLPSYCVEFSGAEKMKKIIRKVSRKGSSKGSSKGSRKYRFIGRDQM